MITFTPGQIAYRLTLRRQRKGKRAILRSVVIPELRGVRVGDLITDENQHDWMLVKIAEEKVLLVGKIFPSANAEEPQPVLKVQGSA